MMKRKNLSGFFLRYLNESTTLECREHQQEGNTQQQYIESLAAWHRPCEPLWHSHCTLLQNTMFDNNKLRICANQWVKLISGKSLITESTEPDAQVQTVQFTDNLNSPINTESF